MNIIIYADYYTPNIGGCETLSRGLAKQFKDMGHNVEVIASRVPYNLPITDSVDGINVTRLNYPIPKPILKHLLAFPLVFPATMLSLIDLFKQKQPDIVIQQYMASNTFYLWCLRKLRKLLKLSDFIWIVCPQGTDIQSRVYEYKFHMWMTKAALKEADYVVGASTYSLEETIKLSPEVKNKSSVIMTAIDLDEFKKPTTLEHPEYRTVTSYILCIGRLVEKKGYDLIIQAYKNIANRPNLIELIIIGFGEKKQELIDLSEKLGISDRVHFVDGKTTSREETVEYIKHALIVAQPSRQEVFGMVAVEGMAAGVPVLATRVDGVPEVTGGYALLADPTPLALEKGLNMLLDLSTEERAKLTAEAKEYVFKKYSFERACNEYLAASQVATKIRDARRIMEYKNYH